MKILEHSIPVLPLHSFSVCEINLMLRYETLQRSREETDAILR
jgi:hypothetical protein